MWACTENLRRIRIPGSFLFPTLDSYRAAWEEQSRDFAREKFADDPHTMLHSAMRLDPIQLQGDDALVHKKFAGELRTMDGKTISAALAEFVFCAPDGGAMETAGICGLFALARAGGRGR